VKLNWKVRWFPVIAGGLGWGESFLFAITCLAAFAQSAAQVPAQAPNWQTAAGGKRAFEVASVKLDTGPFRPPNFPLDPGDAYRPVGGRFSADFPLSTYIAFAYKLSLSSDQRQAMLSHLPDWVSTDRYAIEARTEGRPTKDEMRLMVQSLLAERFKFAAHFENRVFSALALVLLRPGKTGPRLRPHSEGVPCESTPATNAPVTSTGDVFPPVCDVVVMSSNAKHIAKGGSRNITMALLAGALAGMGRLDRPIVDQTGLSARFDFTLEFEPEPARTAEPTADPAPEFQGPSFVEALREQLGLKLESTKAPLQHLVIDHVERPSEN
jgi:uncharacterized protein (TIGR03435 family)